ncbi:MAG: hypothetical protein LQ352_005084 [Teloschistes flavicans]|nr:MAG: hypothetical protein LQ352_005084 [Teloschistes flavicans]
MAYEQGHDTWATENTPPILPLPTKGDNFEMLATKMCALAAVVSRGQSVAVRTGYRATTMAGKDPEAVALEGMKDLERQMYKAWKNGHRLEPLDFAQFPDAKPNAKLMKKYQGEAAALSIMYGVPDVTAAQAVGWTRMETYLIPLMKAIVRVERQKVAMTGGSARLTPAELGELQTLKKILALLSATVQAGKEETKKLSRKLTKQGPKTMMLQRGVARLTQSIAHHDQILRARLHGLRKKNSAR